MGVINKCTYQSPQKQSVILSSNRCLARPEIHLLIRICSPKEEDCSCNWEDVKYKQPRVKKKPKGCKKMKWSKRLQCIKKKAVCELYRFMKFIKGNIALIKRFGQTSENTLSGKYTSIEPIFVLAHLSAKMLQFEKKMKNLPCSENDNCRLAIFMKTVKRNILLQFICGPQVNKALVGTIRDIANIDCLLNKMEGRCLCSTASNPSFIETSNKAVNTDRDDNNGKSYNSRKGEDKATVYDIPTQINNQLDSHRHSNKHWLYTYRERNGTKATEFGDHKKNLTYYYDVSQINRLTSTSDIPFEGDIAYPDEEIFISDKSIQTEACFTFNESYEITAVCVTYNNERSVNELDHLPELNNVTNDFVESDIFEENLYEKREEGEKTYMTRVQGLNVVAETKTNINMEEITVTYNNDPSETYTTTGNSTKADSNIITLKQELFDQVKKVATQIVDNYYRERDKSEESSINAQNSGFIWNSNEPTRIRI